ncbi:hypothetical protein [Pontibacter litorisediminis]|uniref:hypothetical protein n=1 Tax=Pontibacter litorisediminis TaxID=1846260 RepID=UPI0023ED577D|nr:hypothetical protein [Pontibacter litorisediminis]
MTKYLFVPTNLDLKSMLPEKRHKHIDKYHYFIHKLFEERILNKMNDNRQGYVSISSEAMREVVTPQQYTHIIRFLLDNNIVERDGIYSNGGDMGIYDPKCYWYRLTQPYRQDVARQMMVVDAAFEAKLTRKKHEAMKKTIVATPHLQFLHFNLLDLQIDHEGALAMIDEMLATDSEYTVEQHNIDTLAILKIKNGEFFMVRDMVVNRVHNNLTSFPKRLRPFLRVASGEALVNLDIRNSQPLLLSLVLKHHYPGTMPEDVAKYIQLCETGQFYEHMMDLMGVPACPVHREKIRKPFKEACFAHIFYCRYNPHYQYEDAKAFKKAFPNCFKVIVQEKKGNYKNLSIKMQQAESELMIDRVVKHLADLGQNIFALSIHDSLVVTKGHADYVRQLMLDEFAAQGVYPTINVEPLSSSIPLTVGSTGEDKTCAAPHPVPPSL